MARNYGISMFLLFLVAIIYRNRKKYPLLLALVLALLANTNFPSAVLVGLIAALWTRDMIDEHRTKSIQIGGYSRYLSFVIIFAGFLLCIATTIPKKETIWFSMNTVDMRSLIQSFFEAVLHPEQTFSALVPSVIPPLVVWILLYLAVFGLLVRPSFFLAALGAQISFGVLFRIANKGMYRHQGLYLVFLLFLYWLCCDLLIKKKDGNKMKKKLFNTGFYIALLVLILGNVVKTKSYVLADIEMERSSSKAFGEFLNKSTTYQDAIIVPEPDYLVESLPYYAKNKIFLPREHRFGTTVSWTTKSNQHLSLGELLSLAHNLKNRYDKNVLIVMGHLELYRHDHYEKNYSFNKVFLWDTKQFEEFSRSTIPVAEFMSAYSDENYWIFAVK